MTTTDTDCFWFPQLEKCQNPEPIEPTPGTGGEDADAPLLKIVYVDKRENIAEDLASPMMGQIMYLTVAMLNAAAAYLI